MSSNGVCVVRRELVALVKSKGGVRCHELAMLLNQALYKTQDNKTASKIVSEDAAYSREPEPDFDFKHGWFHKSAQEWADETMIDASTDTIRKMLKWLEDSGFILSRNNPRHRWDKILQYRVNVTYIVDELAKLGLQLKGFESLTETLETSLKPPTAFSETLEAEAVLKSLFKEPLKETTLAAPQNGSACAPLQPPQATTKTVRGKDDFALNPDGDKWQNAATRCLFYFYQLTNRAITNDKAKQKRYFQIVTKWWADAKGVNIQDTEQRLRTILEQVIRDTNKAQKSKDKTERLTLVDPQSYDKYVTGALSEMRGREQYHGG